MKRNMRGEKQFPGRKSAQHFKAEGCIPSVSVGGKGDIENDL